MKVLLGSMAAVIVALTSVGSQGPVAAATIEVTSLADDGGTGTLREAITAANSTSGDDVITFASSLSGTITLTSALPTISDNLTITGPGESDLTIDGDAQFRVFDTTTTNGKTLVLSGMTLRNGQGVDGGLLYNMRNTVLITDVTFRDQSSGKAIVSNQAGSYVTCTRCTFSELAHAYSADYGATPVLPDGESSWVAYNDDSAFTNTATFIQSTFLNNTTAISTERYTKIVDSTFSGNGNAANIRGLNRSQITGSTFRDNTIAVSHFAWIPTTSNMGTDNRLIHDNTFIGNTIAIRLTDSKNDNSRYQGWATVTGNRWDESGTWVYWETHDGSSNITFSEVELDRAGTEYSASGNTYLDRLNAPTSVSLTAGSGQLAVSWTSPTPTGAGTSVESYTVAWSEDPSWSSAVTATTTDTSVVLTELTPGTEYYVRVRAENAAVSVNSDWSEVVSATPMTPDTSTTTTTVADTTTTTTVADTTTTVATLPVTGSSNGSINPVLLALGFGGLLALFARRRVTER
jgi:hypothetical protein